MRETCIHTTLKLRPGSGGNTASQRCVVALLFIHLVSCPPVADPVGTAAEGAAREIVQGEVACGAGGGPREEGGWEIAEPLGDAGEAVVEEVEGDELRHVAEVARDGAGEKVVRKAEAAQLRKTADARERPVRSLPLRST